MFIYNKYYSIEKGREKNTETERTNGMFDHGDPFATRRNGRGIALGKG